MPTYDYGCEKCETVFEAFHGINENPVLKCPECGSEDVSKKISSGAGIVFKGSGFYVNDYKKKEQKSGTESKETKEQSSKSEKTAETKTKAEK